MIRNIAALRASNPHIVTELDHGASGEKQTKGGPALPFSPPPFPFTHDRHICRSIIVKSAYVAAWNL